MIRQSKYERLTAVSIAITLHVAVGCALFLAARVGVTTPDRKEDETAKVVNISLVAYNQPSNVQGLFSRQITPSRDTQPVVAVQKTSTATQSATAFARPAAAASVLSSTAGEVSATADAHTMANLPPAEILAYRAELEAHLAHYRLYPADARSEGSQGVVALHFVVDRSGSVVEAWIENSSGVDSIDHEAIAAVHRAEPLPIFPGDFPAQLDIRLPVAFKLN
jgi:periplasmic protein TonB